MKLALKIENNSGWNIDDLIKKFGERLAQRCKQKYTNPEAVFEKDLIDFLISLPSGDYSDIHDQYYNDELMFLHPIKKEI